MSIDSRGCPSCATPVPVGASFCPSCGQATPIEISQATSVELRRESGPIDEPAQRDRIQRALGDAFQLGRLLGRGGFADVYAAVDSTLKRGVAVKVLRADLVVTRELLERFRREAEVVAQLRHPHIVPLYSVGQGEGFVWFTMPLVEGESLRSLLGRDGALPIDDAVRILIEVAGALGAAHKAGLVHRDVKPENVMLDGEERRALLMDFGIAKAAGAGETGLTGTGMVVGTPHYMSPEQATGEATIDHRSDLYTLGVLGFELLTGLPPFSGANFGQIVANHLSGVIPDVRSHRPSVSVPLAAVIAHAMASHPDQRFQSAADFATALRAATSAHAALMPGAGTGRATWHGWRKWPRGRVLWSGSFLAVAVIGVTALLLSRPREVPVRWAAGAREGVSTAWRTTEVGRPYLQIATEADSALLVVGAYDNGIGRYDGTSWRHVGAKLRVTGMTAGDAAWVIAGRYLNDHSLGTEPRRLWLVGDSAQEVGSLPNENWYRPATAWLWHDTLVVGTSDGELWRRVGSQWRRDATGSLRGVIRIWGRGQRLFALTLVPSDSLDDWVLAFSGAGWDRIDPHPDPVGRTTYYEDGASLPDGSVLLAANSCDTAGYRGACRPLLLRQDAEGRSWEEQPLRAPDSLRLFGIWSQRQTEVLLWGYIGTTDNQRPVIGRVRDGVLEPLSGLPGEAVVGVATLRGMPHVLLESGSIWAEAGGRWVAVTRVPENSVVDASVSRFFGVMAAINDGQLWAWDSAFSTRAGIGAMRKIARLAVRDSTIVMLNRDGRTLQLSCKQEPEFGFQCNSAAVSGADSLRLVDITSADDGRVFGLERRGLVELVRGRWVSRATEPLYGGDTLSGFARGPRGSVIVMSRYSPMAESAGTWRYSSVPSAHEGRQRMAPLDSGMLAVSGSNGVEVWRMSATNGRWEQRYFVSTQGIAAVLHTLPDGRLVIGLGVTDDPMVSGGLMILAPPYDSTRVARVPLPARTAPVLLTDDGHCLHVWGLGWKLLSIPLDSLPLRIPGPPAARPSVGRACGS